MEVTLRRQRDQCGRGLCLLLVRFGGTQVIRMIGDREKDSGPD